MTDSNLMIEVNGAHFRALHATAAADVLAIVLPARR